MVIWKQVLNFVTLLKFDLFVINLYSNVDLNFFNYYLINFERNFIITIIIEIIFYFGYYFIQSNH